MQHRRAGLKGHRSPENDEQIEPELRSGFGLYGIGDGRERGKRPRIGISQVQTVSDHTHEKGPKRGSPAARTADADTKQ